MEIQIAIVKLGKLYLAATILGSITVRGRAADDEAGAVRNLFYRLAGVDGDDDARIAVELAVAGVDLTTATRQALGDGSTS